jgi:transcription initiation factor TFIID subunit 5
MVMRGHSDPVYACSLSPDYKHVLSASGDGTVRLWNLGMKANLACYRGHSSAVCASCPCPTPAGPS